MEELYQKGKIRAIGLSNFMPEHIDYLMKHTKIIPAIDQVELHPGLPCNKLLQYAKKHNIIVESWGPLASGKTLKDDQLQTIANKYHKTVAQLCLR
jgi:diketogulonate reductase-like aldo/keto reductase